MKTNQIIYFVFLLAINILLQGKIMSLEVSLCNLEGYQNITTLYQELHSLPKIDFKIFPKEEPEKMQALKDSITLTVSQTYLVENSSGAPEKFIFSPHIVDCVGLVVSQNLHEQKHMFVGHLARDSKERILEEFFNYHFSASSTVLLMTSVQSDVLLFVYNQLKGKGFNKIFAQFGPIVRDLNKFYVPAFMLQGDLTDVSNVAREVKKWTTSTMIVSTITGELCVLDPEEDWLDSEKVLTLKSSH